MKFLNTYLTLSLFYLKFLYLLRSILYLVSNEKQSHFIVNYYVEHFFEVSKLPNILTIVILSYLIVQLLKSIVLKNSVTKILNR